VEWSPPGHGNRSHNHARCTVIHTTEFEGVCDTARFVIALKAQGDPVHTYSNYIAGADVPAADGRTFTAFNPTTGGVWGTFALAGAVEVDRAVKAASDAVRTGPWGKLSPT